MCVILGASKQQKTKEIRINKYETRASINKVSLMTQNTSVSYSSVVEYPSTLSEFIATSFGEVQKEGLETLTEVNNHTIVIITTAFKSQCIYNGT